LPSLLRVTLPVCAHYLSMKGDIVVNGKRGLDGFPGTDLESHLVKKKIEVR
jgi:hypothetical protein